MAKRTNKVDKDSITYDIREVFGVVKESGSHDWITAVLKVSWNDNPATVDIRNCNLTQHRMGKGVSLSNEEADMMVDILLQNDFGSIDELERALDKRKSIFTPVKKSKKKNNVPINIEVTFG